MNDEPIVRRAFIPQFWRKGYSFVNVSRLALLLLASLALTGCSDDKLKKLEQRVSALEIQNTFLSEHANILDRRIDDTSSNVIQLNYLSSSNAASSTAMCKVMNGMIDEIQKNKDQTAAIIEHIQLTARKEVRELHH